MPTATIYPITPTRRSALGFSPTAFLDSLAAPALAAAPLVTAETPIGALHRQLRDVAARHSEQRAKIVAPIVAVSPAGMQAKAEVMQRLSDPGMALYTVRIMASSLARDVLTLEGALCPARSVRPASRPRPSRRCFRTGRRRTILHAGGPSRRADPPTRETRNPR